MSIESDSALGSASDTDQFRKRRLTRQTTVPSLRRWGTNLPALWRAARRDNVGEGFGERIMLAVTAVNECRYCARAHSNMATEAGVDTEVVEQILERDIEAAVSEEELPALTFAQTYAETDGDPPAEAWATLRAAYDAETVDDILAYVRNIHFWNLLGNTVDYVRTRVPGLSV